MNEFQVFRVFNHQYLQNFIAFKIAAILKLCWCLIWRSEIIIHRNVIMLRPLVNFISNTKSDTTNLQHIIENYTTYWTLQKSLSKFIRRIQFIQFNRKKNLRSINYYLLTLHRWQILENITPSTCIWLDITECMYRGINSSTSINIYDDKSMNNGNKDDELILWREIMWNLKVEN